MHFLKKSLITPAIAAVIFIAVLGVILFVIALNGVMDEADGAASVGRATGYRSALQRGFFLNDSNRASRPEIFLAARPFKLPLCEPANISPLAANTTCLIAASTLVSRPSEARCDSKANDICVALTVHEALFTEPALRARVIAILKNPCGFLLDNDSIDRLRAEVRSGNTEFGPGVDDELFSQRESRRDLRCDDGAQTVRRAIISYGDKLEALTFKPGQDFQ